MPLSVFIIKSVACNLVIVCFRIPKWVERLLPRVVLCMYMYLVCGTFVQLKSREIDQMTSSLTFLTRNSILNTRNYLFGGKSKNISQITLAFVYVNFRKQIKKSQKLTHFNKTEDHAVFDSWCCSQKFTSLRDHPTSVQYFSCIFFFLPEVWIQNKTVNTTKVVRGYSYSTAT